MTPPPPPPQNPHLGDDGESWPLSSFCRGQWNREEREDGGVLASLTLSVFSSIWCRLQATSAKINVKCTSVALFWRAGGGSGSCAILEKRALPNSHARSAAAAQYRKSCTIWTADAAIKSLMALAAAHATRGPRKRCFRRRCARVAATTAVLASADAPPIDVFQFEISEGRREKWWRGGLRVESE